jgi:hypothetical protein
VGHAGDDDPKQEEQVDKPFRETGHSVVDNTASDVKNFVL